MTRTGGIGCALIGLGPCLLLFIFTVANSSIKVILLTASGFFWLIALLISSIIWYIITPLRDVLLFGLVEAVIIQEISRFVFYKLISKVDIGLQSITTTQNRTVKTVRLHSMTADESQRRTDVGSSSSPNSSTTTPSQIIENQEEAVGLLHPNRILTNIDDTGTLLNKPIVAYVAGMGFGLQSCVVPFLPILINSFGPGIQVNGWESQIYFLIAAIDTMCMSLLQIFWTVILFISFDRLSYSRMVVVYATHLGLSCLSLLNDYPFPWPELVSSIYFISLIGTIAFAYLTLVARQPRRQRLIDNETTTTTNAVTT